MKSVLHIQHIQIIRLNYLNKHFISFLKMEENTYFQIGGF